MTTASNLEKNRLALIRGSLSREGGLDLAIELVEATPAGAGKNPAIAAICDHLVARGNTPRATGFVGRMTPSPDRDAVINRLCAHDLGLQGTYSLLTKMTAGPARDAYVSTLIEKCRASGEGVCLVSAGLLYDNAQTRARFFEDLVATSLAGREIERAMAAYDALGRRPRNREKEPLLAAAMLSGDLARMRQVCEFCGREPPTVKEMSSLVEVAVNGSRYVLAMATIRDMPAGEEKTAACRYMTSSFGSNSEDPVSSINEMLECAHEMPESDRPRAYEMMKAVCVKHGRYAVAYRVENASGRKLTNPEILAMLAVCREQRGSFCDHLQLAKHMVGGEEKTAAIEAMIPDLIRVGEVAAVKEAAELCDHVLLRGEVEQLVRSARYRGAEAVMSAVALLDGELTTEEAAALLTR